MDGYWKTFDWEDAISRGHEIMELPWSGEMGFVDSRYVYPTTHMVAPKKDVVNCAQCHVREDSRLSNLAGFYMPGRDRFRLLDMAGWGLALAALAAVILHGLGRIFTNGRTKEE